MIIKKSYEVGDSVWIYGIDKANKNPVHGTVIKKIDLSDAGYENGPYYIIEIPTHIEPLFEIRTWENISQDEKGPVGLFRDLNDFEPSKKYMSKMGFDTAELDELDDPDPAEICAALEKSIDNANHPPFIIKSNKQRNNRKFNRKRP